MNDGKIEQNQQRGGEGRKDGRREGRRVAAWIGGVLLAGAAVVALATPRLNTTIKDFYFFGTQPTATFPFNPDFAELASPDVCSGCHKDFEGTQPSSYALPYERWPYTMMGQAYRDPVFLALMQITERELPSSSDTCLRCHAPAGWVQDRRKPPGTLLPGGDPDPQALVASDLQGVTCISCHRQVDPVERADRTDIPPRPPSQNTEEIDRGLLAALGAQVNPHSITGNNRPPDFAPQGVGPGGPINANGYVIDNRDRRRGPVDLGFFFFHNWLESPLHKTSQVCASCHDISNALFARQPDGSYQLNGLDAAHPTGNKYDMFPMDRLYSQWLMSDFATGPVTLTVPNPNGAPGQVGRYSYDGVTLVSETTDLLIFNNRTSYDTCQSCHQQETTATGCDPGYSPPVRDTIPVHHFVGTNSWVIRAVNDLYFPADTLMEDPTRVDESARRAAHMRAVASDLELSFGGGSLTTRVINQTGHSLPSGFGEGRRVWVNVKFFDASNQLVAERGGYDAATATLDESGTKVYQIKVGIDSTTFGTLPPGSTLPPDGPSFFLELNNKVFFDNRIPPRGFTNAKFAAVQSAPVGYSYADGQYWDDSSFAIPSGATRAEVRVFGQTTSKDFVEFLRDNATDVSTFVNQPSGVTWTLPPEYTPTLPLTLGQIVYAQWIKWGKSAPVLMDSASISFQCNPADIAQTDGAPGGDGAVDNGDFQLFFTSFFAANCAECGTPGAAACNPADIAQTDGSAGSDGCVDNGDFQLFFTNFFAGCP